MNIVHHLPVAWAVFTAIVNVLLRTRTPEQWVERCERTPRFAAFTRFMRSVGVDPVKMVQALGEFTAGGKV